MASLWEDWEPRETVLAPEAVWVPDARPYATAWSRDPRRTLWRGLAHEHGLLLVGPDLPWSDGAHWLGVDPHAPALLVPTATRPTLPIDLVQDALLAAFHAASPPLAVLPGRRLLLPAGEAGRLDPDRLAVRAQR